MNRWLPSLIKRQPDLYRAVYDWNVYPHRWALAAWLEAVAAPATVVTWLERSTSGRRRLSTCFRNRLGLTETCWDFQAPKRRLALLSAATLGRIARFSGAALHASRLALVVTKDERRELTARIGEDAYAFALRRGRLLPVTNGLGRLAGTDGDLGRSIERAGWQSLFACLGDEPEAVRLRFRLKTPRREDLPTTDGIAATEAWSFVQPIVRELLNPEEARCFA